MPPSEGKLRRRRAEAAAALWALLGGSADIAWAACPPRFEPPAGPPPHASYFNGARVASGCFNREGAKVYHVFVIGDWGGVQASDDAPPQPADHRSHYFPKHARPFVAGVDDVAQLRVAARMRDRANASQPDYVLNAGDNFYWGGIDTHCGRPLAEHVPTGQWRGVFEEVYSGWEGQWLGVLGNHDYGGYVFSAGWDQAIGYTWVGPGSSGRWLTPAQYWSTTARYPDFSVDYFFVDTNVFLALNPDTDSGHNICNLKHNTRSENGPDTCGAHGPQSTWDCPGWFGRLWAAQIEWLDQGLAMSSADWQIVVTHFPPTFGNEEWSYLAERHGLDLIVSGHRHQQEVHYREPFLNLTAWLVSGGGGGITSEGMPDADGHDDMYGFFDLSLTREEILIEAISHGGLVRSRTRVEKRHPCTTCYQVPTFTGTTLSTTTGSTETATSVLPRTFTARSSAATTSTATTRTTTTISRTTTTAGFWGHLLDEIEQQASVPPTTSRAQSSAAATSTTTTTIAAATTVSHVPEKHGFFAHLLDEIEEQVSAFTDTTSSATDGSPVAAGSVLPTTSSTRSSSAATTVAWMTGTTTITSTLVAATKASHVHEKQGFFTHLPDEIEEQVSAFTDTTSAATDGSPVAAGSVLPTTSSTRSSSAATTVAWMTGTTTKTSTSTSVEIHNLPAHMQDEMQRQVGSTLLT